MEVKKIASEILKEFKKQTFIESVLKKGYILLDDGKIRFVVIKINDKNFKDISQNLKQQLKNEGKWDSWISFITTNTNKQKYSIQELPIYGSSEKYITKWFSNSPEEAIKQSLSDRKMQLLQRANEYVSLSLSLSNKTAASDNSVKEEISDFLNKAGIKFKEINISPEKEISVIMNQIALGKNWEKVEDKFYSLFPHGTYKKFDIYLQGEK